MAAGDPTALFLIVGDGERRRELEQLARAHGIADRTRFLGWRRDVATIYSATDVFLLTSRNEGTPVALIEALAAGVPGVSTDVGGVRDVIHSGASGLLAPPGDVRVLASAWRRCCTTRGNAAPWANADESGGRRGTTSIASSAISTRCTGTFEPDTVQSRAMVFRRPLLLVCLVAALHGLFFIWYQRPDWNIAWSDQDGYRRLGQVLAQTGMFTRVPDAPRFVPEVIRTPAYPAFLAALYRVFGVGQLPVALAQTALFVLICVLSCTRLRAPLSPR